MLQSFFPKPWGSDPPPPSPDLLTKYPRSSYLELEIMNWIGISFLRIPGQNSIDDCGGLENILWTDYIVH